MTARNGFELPIPMPMRWRRPIPTSRTFAKATSKSGCPGLAPGTNVAVGLKRHAFNFGTAVAGNSTSEVNTYLGSTSNPNSTAYKYQQALAASKFNAIVPENAGKWGNNAATSANSYDMTNVDTILNFAEAKNLRVRMHNLIWGSQQPGWVNTLLTDAASGSGTPLPRPLRCGTKSASGSRIMLRTVPNATPTSMCTTRRFTRRNIGISITPMALPRFTTKLPRRCQRAITIRDFSPMSTTYYRTAATITVIGTFRTYESILSQGGAVSGVGVQSYENNAIGTSFECALSRPQNANVAKSVGPGHADCLDRVWRKGSDQSDECDDDVGRHRSPGVRHAGCDRLFHVGLLARQYLSRRRRLL